MLLGLRVMPAAVSNKSVSWTGSMLWLMLQQISRLFYPFTTLLRLEREKIINHLNSLKCWEWLFLPLEPSYGDCAVIGRSQPGEGVQKTVNYCYTGCIWQEPKKRSTTVCRCVWEKTIITFMSQSLQTLGNVKPAKNNFDGWKMTGECVTLRRCHFSPVSETEAECSPPLFSLLQLVFWLLILLSSLHFKPPVMLPYITETKQQQKGADLIGCCDQTRLCD